MPPAFHLAIEANLPAAAQWLLTNLSNRTIVLLDGPMGAGKTTLTRAVAEALGVTDNVASPTYGLVHEYRTASGQPLYHFDLYRLNLPQEALDFGVFEYFDSGALCLIEWPERLGPELLADLPEAARLRLDVLPDGARHLTLTLP